MMRFMHSLNHKAIRRVFIPIFILIISFALLVALPNVSAQLGTSGSTSTRAFTNCSAVQVLDPADCTTLVALYNSTNGASWTVNTDWLQTDTPCSWYGVTCTVNRVLALNLSGNNLVGTLPVELPILDQMTQLDLSNNRLTGAIPADLDMIAGIETLNLGKNELTGEIPAFTDFADITVLDLHFNQLTGTIPSAIGNLTLLNVLNLESNALEGEIPLEITALDNIAEMRLGYNMLKSTNTTVIDYLNLNSPGWADTQTIAPSSLDLAFTASTFELTATWAAIPYQDDDGAYEVGCSESPSGPFSTYSTRTIDKTSFDLSFYGLPVITVFCRIRTITLPHDLNQNLLVSPPSGVTNTSITVQAPPPANDNFDTPLDVNNTPFQYFVNNFNTTQPGSNIPPLPVDCAPGFDPTNAKAIHFKIPKLPAATTAAASRGGPGFFATGAGAVTAGGPGFFATGRDARDADADTVIAVYKRDANGQFVVIACNDDDPEDLSASGGSELLFDREADQVYRVVVWVKDSDQQQIVVRMATRYGLVNRGFKHDADRNKQPDFWIITNPTQTIRRCNIEKAYKPPCYMQIKGNGTTAGIRQRVFGVSNFVAGDKLIARAQIWRKNVATSGTIQLKIRYVDTTLGDNGKAKMVFEIPPGTSDYVQMKTPKLILEGPISRAIVQIRYNGLGGTLRIDEVGFRRIIPNTDDDQADALPSAEIIPLDVIPLPQAQTSLKSALATSTEK